MSLSFNVLHVGKSIVASVMTPLGIVVIDNAPTIYTYSHGSAYEKHSTLKGFKSYIHRYSTAVATSSNGKYALICDASHERVLLFNLQKNSLASQIKYVKTPDYCLFSDDSVFFVITNSIGRLSLYETFSCEIKIEVQLSDGVCAVAFSQDNTMLAIATLDKKVHLYSVAKKCMQSSFELGEIVEALSFSQDTSAIVLFTRSGNTHIINHLLKQIILADPFSEWPSAIMHSQNKDISLVGTRSNQLFIYTNTHGNNLGSITLDYWGITSINILDEKIFIGFSDGNGVTIDIANFVADAMQALETKNYAQLCSLAAQYPLIFISQKLGDALKRDYLDMFLFEAITHEERQGHNALSAYVLCATQNRHELMQSLYSSPELLPFMEQISSGQITQACSRAHHSPLLRQLREFHDIKSSCLQEVKLELKLLESNPTKFQEHVATMPMRCMECIQGVMPDAKIMEEAYKQLLSSVNAKNFSAVMDIVSKYPLFRQTLIYRRLISSGEALIDKTLIMIEAGKMAEAEKYATMLTRMKPFASTGADFRVQISAYQTFLQACEKGDAAKVFALIEEHSVLRTTDAFKEQIVNYQNKILSPALAFAKQGEVVKTQAFLAPYVAVEYFKEKHLELFKIALAKEIIFYAPLGEEKNLLESYHKCFGWDEYYQYACDALECEANIMRKLDEISEECKQMTSFIIGERRKRNTFPKGLL